MVKEHILKQSLQSAKQDLGKNAKYLTTYRKLMSMEKSMKLMLITKKDKTITLNSKTQI